MCVIPLYSAKIPRQKFSFPCPMQVIGPSPVMTQRRCPFFPESMRLAPRFQVRFHALKCAIGDVMNKKIADDRLGEWRERRHTKIQIMCDFNEHTRRCFLE